MKFNGQVIETRGAETSIDVNAILRVKDGASYVDVREYIAPDFRYWGLDVKPNAGAATTQIDIDADYLYVGGQKFETINQTIDVTDNDDWDSGDAGNEPTDDWIYIWEMSNGTTLLPQFSLSATAPTLRAGIVSAKLISAVFNDGSGDFSDFHQINEFRTIELSATSTGSTGATPLDIDATGIIPHLISDIIYCGSQYYDSAGGTTQVQTTIYDENDHVHGIALSAVSAANTAIDCAIGHCVVPSITGHVKVRSYAVSGGGGDPVGTFHIYGSRLKI